jgi:copper(I)-binding protein
MRPTLPALSLMGTLVTACIHDRTTVAAAGAIAIADAFATASAAPEMSSLYFTVINRGTDDDTVTAITSVAKAELHTMVMRDGLSTMEPVPSLLVPHDSCVIMKPGSYHVMLTGLPTPLAAGDTIPVSVMMARAGAIDMRVPVRSYTDVVEHLDEAGGDCP